MMYKTILIVVIFVFVGKSKLNCTQFEQRLNEIGETYGNLQILFGQELPPDYPPVVKFDDSYDFIIIGAGSAGSVVANRLSEVPQWKILLLEAGDQPPIGGEIPATASALSLTRFSWKYLPERQENFGYGYINQQSPLYGGKVLGGGSGINYMYATRGAPQDYDKWAYQGNPGWSWCDVLPYFMKSEDFRIENSDFGYHKRGGYLTIEEVKNRTISADVFVNSSIENGLNYIDYNGRNRIGVSYIQGTLRTGRRCSTEKAFLRPAKNRKNLTIVPNAQVTRILINPNNKIAYGVQVYYKNKHFTIFANQEIILSAGAVQSPQLLMLSGVGPKDDLRKLGIPLINDLPVGRKLYNHLVYLGVIFTVNDTITTDVNTLFSKENMMNFVRNGDGPLARLDGSNEAIAFLNTINHYPDIEIFYTSTTPTGEQFKETQHLTDEMYNTVYAPTSNQKGFNIWSMLLHPKSFGNITLRTDNPFDPPKIYTNYLTDPEDHDINVMLQGIRYIQQLIKMPSFQKYNATLRKVIQPGCEQYKYDSDDYWKCCIRGVSTTVYHPTTTCKMGPINDKEAVVDPQLRVYGINNLRVIDASIIPVTISGQTNLPTIMVGEKGADLIKQDYGLL